MAASLRRNVCPQTVAQNICKLCDCTSYSASVRQTRNLILKRMKYSSSVLPRDAEITDAVRDRLEDGSHKSHPGIMKLRAVTTPERLERAISVLTEKYRSPTIVNKAERLYNQLMCRKPVVEKQELLGKAAQYETEMMDKENINLDDPVLNDEADLLRKKLKQQVIKHLHHSVYNWKELKYDEFLGLVYLVARAAPNYSVLLQCMTEINRRDPEFVPQSLYNHGSGIGSCVWAADTIWSQRILEHYCVDPSADMNIIARLLLQDADNQKDMHIKGVYFRQFQPSADTNKYNLVVSAYTLMEQMSVHDRLTMVHDLWKMTDQYLLLVENGTSAGYNLIMEARDYILQLQCQDNESLNGHVFAPCPHDFTCSKLLREVKTPCTFTVEHKPLQMQSTKKQKLSEKYSYVIMKKGKRAENEPSWPRCVQPLSKPSRHVHCRLCCPDGTYQHVVITPRRHSRNLYRCAKYCQWGDLLPIDWTDEVSNQLLGNVKDEPEG